MELLTNFEARLVWFAQKDPTIIGFVVDGNGSVYLDRRSDWDSQANFAYDPRSLDVNMIGLENIKINTELAKALGLLSKALYTER